ncbi:MULTISPECIES: hypothetical protein [Exiguobacterium]|jgi:hypothetical protein|uniref:hypothetical protein n=1 Tax=Exiguobacterium TaxID=33986 RepID=UPI001BE9D4B4|nr:MULTISPECIES: hypothetical protein [Exiguobacterium]MCA0981144.1 hypothetical protein [Exiguobacterium aestuarii]
MATYEEVATMFYLDTRRLVDGKEKKQLVRYGPLGGQMDETLMRQFGDLLTALIDVESVNYVVAKESIVY